MTTEELEKRIDGQMETQNLDFKDDCPWDAPKMAKDILAMANTRDGGLIVIGVKEHGLRFMGTGVSESNFSTYKIDEMRDQLARFADPAVDIQVSFPTDSSNKKFIVIKVLPFKEIPVISRIGIEKVIQANVIYYRNSNKRIESAPVSNSNDLRDILELAAIKIMQRRREFGYRAEANVETILDKELENIAGHPLLEKIRSKGYWQIIFQPLQPQPVELLQTWLTAIEKSQVKKEWYFPYIPFRDDALQGRINGGNYCGSFSDLGCRKEYWRAYKSGQFVTFNGLPEDWYNEDQFFHELAKTILPEKFVALFTSIIHPLTQAAEFAGRLGSHGLFKDGIRMKMTLHHIRNRKLYTDSDQGRSLLHAKTTHANQLEVEGQFAIDEVIQRGAELSNKFIIQVLEGFGHYPHPETIMASQKKFLLGTD